MTTATIEINGVRTPLEPRMETLPDGTPTRVWSLPPEDDDETGLPAYMSLNSPRRTVRVNPLSGRPERVPLVRSDSSDGKP